MLDDDFPSRDRYLDSDVIRVAPLAVLMRELNHYVAAQDSAIKPLEVPELLANPILDSSRAVHIPRADLHRQFHGAPIGLVKSLPAC